MTEAFFILAVVIVTALAFDFTNGFHDNVNADWEGGLAPAQTTPARPTADLSA